jgi:hypothetical protein
MLAEGAFMQQTAMPVRRRSGIAFSSGFLLSIFAAIIIFGIGVLTNFRSIQGNTVLIWMVLIALFVTPFLAGLVGTIRSGRIGTGTLAALWDGFLVGIFISIYILLLYLINTPTMPSATMLKQIQTQLAQDGIHVSLQPATVQQFALIGLLILDGFLVALLMGLAAMLGVVGSIIGKIFSPHPRDYIMPPPPRMR